jgi:hypothetical protein
VTNRSLAARVNRRAVPSLPTKPTNDEAVHNLKKHADTIVLAAQHGRARFGKPTAIEDHRDGTGRMTLHYASGAKVTAHRSGEVEVHHPQKA